MIEIVKWEVPERKKKSNEQLMKEYGKMSLVQIIDHKRDVAEARSKETNKRLNRMERQLDRFSVRVRNLEKIIIRHIDLNYDVRLSFKRYYNERMKKHTRNVVE